MTARPRPSRRPVRPVRPVRPRGRRPASRLAVAVLGPLAALALTVAPAAAVATGPAAAAATPPCAQGTAFDAATAPALWAQRQLGADDPRPQFQGWGVTVAVVSSGVDAQHPQLRGRVLPGVSLPGAGDPLRDCLGLGTAVAGTVAAAASADPAAPSPVRGLAPRARILPVRVPDAVAHPAGYLSGDTAQRVGDALADGLALAIGRGADVVVMPSVALPPVAELRAALARAAAAGVLVVVGEPSGLREGFLEPLTDPAVVVAAPVDGGGAPLFTADPGMQDGMRRVAAPGKGVAVLLPGGTGLLDDPAVAAGWVAGGAALLLDADPRTTPAELRRRLLAGPAVAGVPRLDPAASLAAPPAGFAAGRAPDAAGVPGPGSDVVGTLPRQVTPPPARTTSSAVGIALGCLGAAALTTLLAATWTRGRGRRWNPAPPVDVAAVGRRPTPREL